MKPAKRKIQRATGNGARPATTSRRKPGAATHPPTRAGTKSRGAHTRAGTKSRGAHTRTGTTSRGARTRAGTTSRLARTLVDHDEIRSWAESRGGKPTAVKGTSRAKNDVGMIRLDFPGYSGEGKLQPIEWDEWFAKFDASNLALVVQDKTSGGEISHFNKLVAREGPGSRSARRRAGSRSQARTRR